MLYQSALLILHMCKYYSSLYRSFFIRNN